MSSSPSVQAILTALTNLAAFDYGDYQKQITNAFGITEQQFSNTASNEIFNNDQYGTIQLAQDFKVQSIALGVSRTTLEHFSGLVTTTTAQQDLTSTSVSLAVPIYRLYLDAQFATSNLQTTVDQLCSDVTFCSAFVNHVLNPVFINDSLISLYTGGNIAYTEAIAFLYETFRPVLIDLSADYTYYNHLTNKNEPISGVAKSHLSEIPVFAATVSTNSELIKSGKTSQFTTQNIPIQWSNNETLQGPAFQRLGESWATTWMNGNTVDEVVTSLIKKVSYKQSSGGYYHGEAGIKEEYHGEALYNWMCQQQGHGYGGLFHCSGNPSKKSDGYSGPGNDTGSCFAPDTLVATLSGDIPIAELKPYTQILTQAPGICGMTSEERVAHNTVVYQFENLRRVLCLYGFNEEPPFVTPGHIFFTLTGPKAFAPELARKENSDVHIGTLGKGDVLLRLNKDRTGYEKVEITSIISKIAHVPSVHGVHFAKGVAGGDSYHANGYWVAANYPQLTIRGLQKQYESMSIKDRLSFSRQIQALPKTFHKVLGPVVHNAVQTSFTKQTASMTALSNTEKLSTLQRFEHAARERPSIKGFRRKFLVVDNKGLNSLAHHESKNMIDSSLHKDQDTITLFEGAVAVNNELVDHAGMTHQTVQWSRKIDNSEDQYQHGALRALKHGNILVGYTATGPANPSSLTEFTAVTPVTALVDVNTYTMKSSGVTFTSTSAAAAANISDQSDNWTTFWKIEIGLEQEKGKFVPKIRIPDLDAAWNSYMHNQTDAGGFYRNDPPASIQGTNIIVHVGCYPGYGSLWSLLPETNNINPKSMEFRRLTISVDIVTGTAKGWYYAYGATGSGDGAIYALTSTGSTATLDAMRLYTIQHIQQKTKTPIQNIGTDLYNPTANIHLSPLTATSLLSDRLFDESTLSNQNLALIAAPASNDLNQQSQTYLQNAANFWRLQAETKVFGDEKDAMRSKLPTDGSLTDSMSSGGQQWLGKYDRTLIMQSLSGSTQYASRFSNNDNDKVNYYFQGGQKGCLSVDPEYNRISDICAANAFRILTASDLDPYLEDPTNDWALSFYNWCVTDVTLNELVWNYTMGTSENSLVNTYCMILNGLDTKNRGLDAKLWQMMLDKTMVSLSKGTIKGGEDTPAFLQLMMEHIIAEVQTDQTTELNQFLKIDLDNMINAFNTSSAADLAAQVLSNTSPLGSSFYSAMEQAQQVYCLWRNANMPQIMQAWKQSLVNKYPNNGTKLFRFAQYSQSFLMLAMDGLSLFYSIKTMVDWSNLSDAQRVQAVVGLVKTVLTSARDVVRFLKLMKGLDPNDPIFKVRCIQFSSGIGADGGNDVSRPVLNEEGTEEERAPLLDRDGIASVGSSSGEDPLSLQVGEALADPELPETAAKTFDLASGVIGVIGVVATAASAVVLGFQCKNDFSTDQPVGVKVIDIMSEITTGLQVLTGVVEIGIMVIGVECMAIPVVGVILAIAGIVLMFCEMFIHHNPPENPVDKYIDDQLSPYVDGLPTRPVATLTYTLASSTVTCGQSATITIQITNPSSSNLQFRCWIIKFSAGDAGSHLFSAPVGADAKTTPPTPPSSDLVTYTVTTGQNTFNIAGSSVADSQNDSMVAKVTPVGLPTVKSAQLPDGGIVLTLTGTVNATPGTAKVRMVEYAVDRGTGIPSSDYYADLDVTKQQ